MEFALGQGTGPLRGVRVVELAGIGPGPHAAMLLADLGADVIRLERPAGAGSASPRETDVLTRGRPSVAMDLKKPGAVEAVFALGGGAGGVARGVRPRAGGRAGVRAGARVGPETRGGFAP